MNSIERRPKKQVQEPFETTEESGIHKLPKDESPLSVDQVKHELSQRHQPKFLGRGGEHLVYEIPAHPEVVVKADKKSMAQILAWNRKHGLADATDSEEAKRYREDVLSQQRKTFRVLREVFGSEHVLPQKKFFMKVPVTSEVLKDAEDTVSLENLSVPKDAHEAWSMVTVQRRTRAMEDPWCMTFGGNNVEMRNFQQLLKPKFQLRYGQVTDPLMNAETAKESDLSADEFMDLLKSAELDDLLVQAEKDQDLRATIRDCMEKCVAFAERTGEMLDIMGKNNVLFYRKEDEKWTYLFVDPLYGLDQKVLEKGRAAAKQRIAGEPIGAYEQNAIVQGINFTRMVNGVGKVAGSKRFYSFVDAQPSGQPIHALSLIIQKDVEM